MTSTGLNRNTIDKYYTNVEIAQNCIDIVETFFELKSYDLIIEPSAGNGSFSKILEQKYDNVIAIDIIPEYKNIITYDFLTWDLNKYIVERNKSNDESKNKSNDESKNKSNDESKNKFKGENIIIIGNPPFGRQSSTAKKFIAKSVEISNVIAFILPKSFRKTSYQSAFPPNWHLIHDNDIPEFSFTVDEILHDVPCCFQIWKKKRKRRTNIIHQENNKYVFTKASDADISFRRVGVYAGLASDDLTKSKQSHYFIKFNNSNYEYIQKIIEELNNYGWEFNNNTGPKSISKQELIPLLNQLTA